MTDTLDLLRRLSEAYGPPGFEEQVRKIIVEELRGMGYMPQIDRLGNVYVEVGEGRPATLLAAHMDEVGFIVRHIAENGFIKVAALGGIDPCTATGSEVVLLGRRGLIHGILGSIPPHLRRGEAQEQKPKLEDLFIDIGAASREEALEMGVSVGIPAVFNGGFRYLGSAVVGKALDDRVGCYVLLEAFRQAEPPRKGKIYIAFTVQEEVGTRGAHTLAARLKPDYGVAVEGTIAADTPGIPEENRVTRLGGGPALRVMDRTMIADSRLLGWIRGVADSIGVSIQLQVSPYSGSDAGRMILAGAAVAGVAVPVRYIHSPHSLALKTDIEATIRLLTSLIENHHMLS